MIVKTSGVHVATEGRIAVMRRIVERCQHEKIEGRIVSLWDASHYLQIHDSLKPAYQENLNNRDLSNAMGVVWAIFEKRNERAKP